MAPENGGYARMSRSEPDGLFDDPDDDDPLPGASLNKALKCTFTMLPFCCCLFILALAVLSIFPVIMLLTVPLLLISVAFVVIMYCLMSFELRGCPNHYNLCNYWFVQARYAALSAVVGNTAAWYKDIEEEDGCRYGSGPGVNTTTYFGWDNVVQKAADWGPRQQDGTMERENELGFGVLNPQAFPDTGTIALGATTEDHAAFRPFLGRANDGSRLGEGQQCDGSDGWNKTWLVQWFTDRFASVDKFNTGDIQWWVSIILHKVQLNIDISDSDARSFMAGLGPMIKTGLSMAPRRVTGCPLFRLFTCIDCLNNMPRQAKVEELKEACLAKFPGMGLEEDGRKLMLVANAFFDSLAFAGGLSVPTVLQMMLALYYKDDRPEDLDGLNMNDESQLRDFMWETLRRYPAVAGVPRWVTEDGGDSWQHEILSMEGAMQDPSVFPRPSEFRLRRPGMCAADNSRSLCWFDKGIVNGDVANPYSHSCPGKELSQEIIIAFLQAFFAAGPWEPRSCGKISVNAATASKFDLVRS